MRDSWNRAGRILVVDDQEAIHQAFATVLSNTDDGALELERLESLLLDNEPKQPSAPSYKPTFQLEHVYSGDDAVRTLSNFKAQKEHFDVAFVDMRMPGLDGVATIERLWQIDADLQVVICTAYSDYSWSEVTERLGISDSLLLLNKPFNSEEVYQLAVALVCKRWMLAESREQLSALAEANLKLQAEIGQRRSAEHLLAHAASHDSLTGLPNREYIRKAIAHHIDTNDPETTTSALLFLDVDNFKYINDSLGHSVGDELLVQLAARLAEISQQHRESSICDTIVARLGGDEFVLLLSQLDENYDALRVAQSIKNNLTENYILKGHNVAIGVSVGVANFTKDIHVPEQFMKNADLAMYRAKFTGKHCVAAFDETMHRVATRRLELESGLRTAIKNKELRLNFQPIVRVTDCQLVGFESLLRWSRSDGMEISPDEFIPLAEETGLIKSIGRWVVNEACKMLSQINADRANENRLSISVNVSKKQILDPDFVPLMFDLLHEHEIGGDGLVLEITESVVMNSPDLVVRQLHDLKKLGIKLHMDDFGTGHSSLSCLHRFPIDTLKIDRSFVSTMESNADYESIVHAIITLAHNLKTTVIAEGIETEAQLQRLRDLECDFGQGYLFSKPISSDGLFTLIDDLAMRRSLILQSTTRPTTSVKPQAN
ncbi:MAG: EAL domain-containing protein [Planctomycetales bacterium]|nr:EAL domain-containing protein [Planctomycetales bacterium]